MKRTLFTACLGATTILAGAAWAEYPETEIEVIVGYSAGGGTDVMARTVAPYLEEYLGDGATVIVRNMPGASGQIGVTEVAESDADGYTIGTFNLPGMMARTLDRDAAYDIDSFTYLANVVNDPNVIVTPASSDIDSMDALVSTAQEEPGAMTVAMSSLGGDDHLFLIKLQDATDTEMTVVPFSGTAPARTALMGGHVGMGIINLSEAVNFLDELNVVGIASNERSDLAPEVPTLIEQGYEVTNGGLRGFVAPADLPEDVAETLRTAFTQAYEDPDFQEAMLATGNPVELTVGQEFRALTQEQLDLAQRIWETTPWR